MLGTLGSTLLRARFVVCAWIGMCGGAVACGSAQSGSDSHLDASTADAPAEAQLSEGGDDGADDSSMQPDTWEADVPADASVEHPDAEGGSSAGADAAGDAAQMSDGADAMSDAASALDRDTGADGGGPDATVEDGASDAAAAGDVAQPDSGSPVWIVRVSVDSAGTPAHANTDDSSMSSDGRFVAFTSAATNLVASDTNQALDVFVHDVVTGTTVQASVTTAGVEGGYDSQNPVISGNGRYVAFASQGINLCPGKTGFHLDVSLRDLVAGTTSCLSLDASGNAGTGQSNFPSISDDGAYVAFESTSHTMIPSQFIVESQIYVRDVATGTAQIASVDSAGNPGDFASTTAAMSGDGRYVAFVSQSTNLVPGDTNGAKDIFLHDMTTGATERVSISTSGAQSNGDCDYPFVSRDGSLVFFSCSASTLVSGVTQAAYDMFVRDRTSGTTSLVGPPVGTFHSIGGTPIMRPAVSADGRYVAFASNDPSVLPGKNTSGSDVYVVDRTTSQIRRVSRTPSGAGSTGSSVEPSISADGQRVVFDSTANDLVSRSNDGYVALYETTRP
jgi:Tol biopolymer transport system component